MRQISQLEYSMIDGKVQKIAKKHPEFQAGTSFLYLMLQTLFPSSEEEISSLITDGGNDRGADAIHMRETNELAHITIVQSKYANSVKNAKKNFPGNEIDKLISLITDILNKTEGLLETVNSILASKIQDIWRLVDDGKTLSIQIILTSNTLPLVELERKRLQAFCQQYDFIEFEELSFQLVSGLISSDNREKENGVLNCIDVQKYERIDCDIRGMVANIDATSFIDMVTTDDGENIKRHLFDENIRGYLGLSGGFNKQILSSALSDDNHLFWYLNNGITIIANNFSHQKVRGAKIKIENLQIVNGAQTSYSLFQAFKENPEKVAEVVLLVKIFASDREDISERIAIATNSQARISPRDLKANDSVQKKIASIFEDNGIFYERKKNQFEGDISGPVIDSRKLGQVILAYILEEPHQSKTVTEDIFGKMYNFIFSPNLDANFLVKLAKLYLFVSARREAALDMLRREPIDSERNEAVGYTQWHVLYTIKLLAAENKKEIPEENEFEQYLERANETIAKIAKQYKEQSFYRVFRSSKTKDVIRRELGVGQLHFNFNS